MFIKRFPFLTPVNIFLLFAVLIGGAFCVFIPYGAGFDEEMHLVRIYDISHFNLLPNSVEGESFSHREFFDLSYQRRFLQTPAFDLFKEWNFQKQIDSKKPLTSQTRAIYPPVPFLPQAFFAYLTWQVMDVAVIPAVIIFRLVGLLIYVAGVYMAIRILPMGKWVLAVLALSPMALFQASTLNADSFTNAVSFLFIALVLNVYAQRNTPIQTRQVWALGGLSLLLGLSKPGAFFLLPLLLILPRRRFQSREALLIVALSAAFAVFFSIGWTAVTVPASHFGMDGNQSASNQQALALANLADFVITYFRGNLLAFGGYFRDWVGVYGHWVGAVPPIIYLFYPLVLLLALVAEPRAVWFSLRKRIFMIGLFLATSAATLFLFYFANYVPGDLSVLGKQGRYFIPLAPLLFLALAGLMPARLSVFFVGLIDSQVWREHLRRLMPLLSLGLLSLVLGLYAFGLYATYYTECAYTVYTDKPCVFPVYKNLDKATASQVLVNDDTVVSQGFTNTCGRYEALGILMKLVPLDARCLDAVGVLIRSLPDETDGILHYSLLDSTGQVLASQDFTVAEIRIGDYLDLPLDIPPSSTDYRYEIRLEAPDISSPDGIGVAISDQDYYQNGTVVVDGEHLDANLIFRFYCVDPWQPGG